MSHLSLGYRQPQPYTVDAMEAMILHGEDKARHWLDRVAGSRLKAVRVSVSSFQDMTRYCAHGISQSLRRGAVTAESVDSLKRAGKYLLLAITCLGMGIIAPAAVVWANSSMSLAPCLGTARRVARYAANASREFLMGAHLSLLMFPVTTLAHMVFDRYLGIGLDVLTQRGWLSPDGVCMSPYRHYSRMELLVFGVLVAPIKEEIAFRGIRQTGIKWGQQLLNKVAPAQLQDNRVFQVLTSRTARELATSLLFGYMHSYNDWGCRGPMISQCIQCFVTSYFLESSLREDTGALWAPIGAHMAHNLTVFLANGCRF